MKDCCKPCTPRAFPSFLGFTAFSPVVPASYWQIDSEEQRYFALCRMVSKVICYADSMGDQINANTEDIAELKELFRQFQESGFEDYYAQQLAQWIAEHMDDIIAEAIKMVFFGLTDDGYFCAYIPQSWDAVQFDTIMDYSSDNYGCLTLDY